MTTDLAHDGITSIVWEPNNDKKRHNRPKKWVPPPNAVLARDRVIKVEDLDGGEKEAKKFAARVVKDYNVDQGVKKQPLQLARQYTAVKRHAVRAGLQRRAPRYLEISGMKRQKKMARIKANPELYEKWKARLREHAKRASRKKREARLAREKEVAQGLGQRDNDDAGANGDEDMDVDC